MNGFRPIDKYIYPRAIGQQHEFDAVYSSGPDD